MVSSYWQFGRRHWPLLAFGFITVFWGNLGQSFFLSWFGASIQSSLSLTAADYGLVYALATLASGSTIMWLGSAIDRWTLSRFSLVVALGLMCSCLLMSVASNIWLVGVSFFMLRLTGQALMPHTAQTTMIRYFERDRGKAISIASSGVPAGEVVLPALAVLLIALVGWRYSWVLLALSVLLVYIPLRHWLLGHAQDHLAQQHAAHQLSQRQYRRRDILLDSRFLRVLPSALSCPFILTGVFIQQHFLLTQKSWTPAWLASCFVVYGLVHWLSGLAAGSLVDRFGARRLLPFMLSPMVLALLSLALLQGQWVALLFMMFLGAAIGVSGPIVGALWAELYGTTQIGMVRSLVTSLMVFSTAAAPWVMGLFIDRGATAFSLYGGCLVGVIFASALSWRAFPLVLKTR